MAFTPKSWVDQRGHPNARWDAAAAIDLEERLSGYTDARINSEAPYNVLRSDAVGGDTGNQSSAFQDAIDTVQAALGGKGGSLVVPKNTYRLIDQLTYDRAVPLTVIGEGAGSHLHFDSDLGSGVAAIKEAGSAPASSVLGETWFRHLRVTSPEENALYVALNTSPTLMDGLSLSSKCHTDGVLVEGFHGNIILNGDHQILTGRTRASFGYYNLVYPAGAPTNGDQNLIGLDLTHAKRASLNVASGGQCFANLWDEVHLGFAPFGIEMDGNINDLSGDNIAFESCGNMLIWTPGGFASIFDATLTNSGGGLDAGYNVAALPDDYGIELASFHRNQLTNCWGILRKPAGGIGSINLPNAGALQGTEFHGLGTTIATAKANGSQIFIGSGGFGGCKISDQGNDYRLMQPTNAVIATGDLLERTGKDTCQKYASGRVIGVAAHPTAASWQNQLVQVGGNASIKYANATVCALGDLLKPDPANSGAVVKAATHRDGQIVAIANGAPSAGFVDATLVINPKIDDPTLYLPGGLFEIISGTPNRGLFATNRQLAWMLDAAANEVVGSEVLLPDGWGKIDVYIWWTNAGAGSGNVRWGSFRNFIADAANLDVSDVDEAVTVAAPAQAILKRTKLISAATVTGDNRPLRLRIRRDATDAADTLTNDAGLIGVEIVPVI